MAQQLRLQCEKWLVQGHQQARSRSRPGLDPRLGATTLGGCLRKISDYPMRMGVIVTVPALLGGLC